MRARLTEALLDRLKPPGDKAQTYVWDLALPRFGVVLGRPRQTFVINYRAAGLKRRAVIGVRGSLVHGEPLTVDRARTMARAMLATVTDTHKAIEVAERRLYVAIRELARVQLDHVIRRYAASSPVATVATAPRKIGNRLATDPTKA